MYEVDQYTVSLLHFDEGIKDETGKVWTAYGGASTSKTQSKFEGSSLYLNGAKQYLTCKDIANFGTGDWTIDFWIYPLTSDVYTGVFSSAAQTSPNWASCPGSFILAYENPESLVFAHNSGSGNYERLLSGIKILNNKYQHIALVRQGTALMCFINGILVNSATISASDEYNTDGLWVIGREDARDEYYFNGYIDEFRISNVARWTSNFTPAGSINAPTNLISTAGNSQVSLSWTAATGATGYNVKRSTTAGGPYTTIASNVQGTNYVDTSVTNGTTYYYVVTAITASGESANSNEASATPQAQVQSGHSLLRITMNDSSEREYQLSSSEVDAFVKWCDRTVGTGTSLYVFNKTYNVGEFQSRKEYLLFEKIIGFEVMQLAK